MNVLILAEDFYPKESGGAFIDWNVAKHLVEEGDSVTVVTPRNGTSSEVETVDDVEIRRPFEGADPDTHPNSIRGICRRLLFILLLVPYLLNLSRQREYDLVYSTNHLLHAPAATVSAVLGIVHVSFVGYSPSIKKHPSLWDPLVALERLNFRLFMGERVLCQTPTVYELLSGRSSAEIARLDGTLDRKAVESAVRSTESRNNPRSENPGTRLVFAGRLVKIKNAHELPKLISNLPSEYFLSIIGDGPHSDLVKSTVERAEVGDRVELLGRLPHEDTLRMIHESDMLLLPSKADAYPAVVFEALALGTPVLATPVGVLPAIDHPKLIIAPLKKFTEVLSNADIDTREGIDEGTLQRFSVDRFTRDVRSHMLAASSMDD